MNVEAHHQQVRPRRGWVFYDGGCAICAGLARRCQCLLARRGYVLVPLQSPGVAERLHLSPHQLLTEMRVLTVHGQVLGGADAVLYLAETTWWARPLVWFDRLPHMRSRLRRIYRAMARRRHGIAGTCSPRRRPNWLGRLAFSALLVGEVLLRSRLPAWGPMWLLAFTLYAGCKWLTWRRAARDGDLAGRRRSLGYLLAWPGMDPRPFQSRPVETQRPGFAVFLATLARAACGAILFWLVPRRLAPGYPIAAGWVGMIGLLLILHFGCFELLALLWRRAGVDVRSIMQAPLRARSLSDFWSSRWNSAFRDLAHRFVLRPMTGFVGVPGAVLATYLASGLLHELVISVPARAAYGQPTAYFLFQGLGVRFERSRVGRRLHLNRGLAGRLFALLCVAVPAYWLFHPPFVLHVFVPFMRALRALG